MAFLLQGTVLRLLARLGSRLEDNVNRQALRGARVSPLFNHVHANLSATLRVGELAELMKMTPEHLARAFSADTGMTVKQFLVHQLRQRACALIAFGNLRSKEVAAALHFRDAHEFTRFFVRSTGVTPSRYRSSHGAAPP